MCDSCVCLLAVTEVALWNEDVPHAEHTEASKLLGRVEYDGRKPGGHLGVETNLDSGLYFILAFDQQIE